MKKNKILIIVLVTMALVLLLMKTLAIYVYSIDVSKGPSTPFRSDSIKNKEYKTTLYYNESKEPFFKVTLLHLHDSTSYVKSGQLGSHFSIDSEGKDIKIIPESIKLIHRDKLTGKVLKVLEKHSYGFEKDSNGGVVLLYEAKGLPKLIEEEVSFEIIENGKKRVIKYIFTIESTYSGTFIDRLMGV